MPESDDNVRHEIGHVLFIDIVGYSRLLIEEQKERLNQLTEIVLATAQVREATDEQLVRLPTGDGVALVFRRSVEEPARCALEIAEALQKHPELPVRMGIHSGPVSEVNDVSGRSNIAGAGINMAQRVMDCGDAGHILLSQRVADDLVQYRQWAPRLRDLGECEVKHGVRLHLVNLYAEPLGNPEPPEKFRQIVALASMPSPLVKPKRMPWHEVVVVALLLALLIGAGVFYFRQRTASTVSTSRAAPGVPEKSIAVLPFENLSEEKANAFFTDGVQDEILTHLARIADLKVISRTSVMQYKSGAPRNLREIGQQLGVAHVIEGSVQRAANKVRVIAQLIDTRNDAHLWAQTYDRDLADVFAIQSEIAKAIADQLRARLSPKEVAAMEKPPTADVNAYDLYLQARTLFADTAEYLHAKEKLPRAERLLKEAVSRDPNFLLAWCLLAKVHDTAYWESYDHTPARLEQANAAVQTALRLQPEAGESHLALAYYYYHGFRDYERTKSELAIARQRLPNSAEVFELTAYIARREGQWKEATQNLERAIELDPRNFLTLQQLALTYRLQRRYEQEIAAWNRALAIVPGDPATRTFRAQVDLAWRGDITPLQQTQSALLAEDAKVAPEVDDPNYSLCERSTAAAARVLAAYPRTGVVHNGVNYPYTYWEGVIARLQGDAARAEAAFSAARSEVAHSVEERPDFAGSLSLLGLIDAGLGRKEDALREGRRACELLPMSADAIDGTAFAVNLAQIYAWTGEKNLAIDQIAAVLKAPSSLSYGLLRLHPLWDPLRGDPRFEKVVQSLAPKEGK